jgi:ATP-dependent Clp protease ATP-binding subunit ClpA
MGRLVQEKIKQPLAEELLFGKLVNGGEVKIRIKENAPSFEITRPRQGPQGKGQGKRKKTKSRTSRQLQSKWRPKQEGREYSRPFLTENRASGRAEGRL